MSDPRTLQAVFQFIEAGVLIGVSIPLILGRVAPNRWYGFRVKRTLQDPAVWYPANRFAGWQICGAAVVFLVVAITLRFVPSVSAVAYIWICNSVMFVGIMVAVIRCFLFLHRFPR